MTLSFLQRTTMDDLDSINLLDYMRLLGTVIKSRNFLHKTGNARRFNRENYIYCCPACFYFVSILSNRVGLKNHSLQSISTKNVNWRSKYAQHMNDSRKKNTKPIVILTYIQGFCYFFPRWNTNYIAKVLYVILKGIPLRYCCLNLNSYFILIITKLIKLPSLLCRHLPINNC